MKYIRYDFSFQSSHLLDSPFSCFCHIWFSKNHPKSLSPQVKAIRCRLPLAILSASLYPNLVRSALPQSLPSDPLHFSWGEMVGRSDMRSSTLCRPHLCPSTDRRRSWEQDQVALVTSVLQEPWMPAYSSVPGTGAGSAWPFARLQSPASVSSHPSPQLETQAGAQKVSVQESIPPQSRGLCSLSGRDLMLMPLTSDGAILEMNEGFGEQLQDFPGRRQDERIGWKPRAPLRVIWGRISSDTLHEPPKSLGALKSIVKYFSDSRDRKLQGRRRRGTLSLHYCRVGLPTPSVR